MSAEKHCLSSGSHCLNRLTPSLHPHQLCDRRGKHHQLLVFVEEELEAGKVAVLLVREPLFSQKPGHDGLHLQTHGLSFTVASVNKQMSNIHMLFLPSNTCDQTGRGRDGAPRGS